MAPFGISIVALVAAIVRRILQLACYFVLAYTLSCLRIAQVLGRLELVGCLSVLDLFVELLLISRACCSRHFFLIAFENF